MAKKLFRIRVPDSYKPQDGENQEAELSKFRKDLSSQFIQAGGKGGKANISGMTLDEHCSDPTLCIKVSGKMTQGQQSMMSNLSL